jgi:hypothetical protein
MDDAIFLGNGPLAARFLFGEDHGVDVLTVRGTVQGIRQGLCSKVGISEP